MNSITQNWTAREYISIIGICVFGFFGSILQLIFFRLLWKIKDSKLFAKHLKVRGKIIFITHCIMNFYWASLHPIIVGIVFLFYSNKLFVLITMYCYGIVALEIMITIYCTRCWILFFNFNYYALHFQKIWKKKLQSTHYHLSWYERNKQFGNVVVVLGIGITVSFILSTAMIIFAYYSKLSISWFLFSGLEISLLNIISIYLVLKLHTKHSIDNFGMRLELTWFALVILLVTIIGAIFFFFINDYWIRLWIINSPIHFACLFVNIYQFHYLYKQISTKSSDMDTEIGTADGACRYMEEIQLIDLLKDATGINEFARFLISEFSLEHLLFLIEVSQFRNQFDITVEDGSSLQVIVSTQPQAPTITLSTIQTDQLQIIDEIDEKDEELEYKFQLSEHVPLSATIIDNINPVHQAIIIRDKFIASKSEFAVNLNGKNKKEILELDLENVSNVELKHMFDSAYKDIYLLLKLDSFKRFIDASDSAQILLKKIYRGKKRKYKRKRSRAKSRDKYLKKLNYKMKKQKSAPSVVSVGNNSPSLQVQPIPMIKSFSLNTAQRADAMEPDSDCDLSDSAQETEEKSATSAVSYEYDEDKLADPFNNIIRTDINNPLSPRQTTTIQTSLHHVLHVAATKTDSVCCCKC